MKKARTKVHKIINDYLAIVSWINFFLYIFALSKIFYNKNVLPF